MDTHLAKQLPITAIIATANRPAVLRNTLESLAKQNFHPVEIIIVDASNNHDTKAVLLDGGFVALGLQSKINYVTAIDKGAAVQRNQGIALASQSHIFFMDDDILFEPHCIEKLWACLISSENIGGVNAMVTNQQYHTPGKVTRFMYRFLSGKNLLSYAGKCIGPAWNLLPEDRAELPECNEVEWLNTTCTLYKKAALPNPVFQSHFTGYSLMEDLALSLEVGKKWKLYNARTARIFHDSQPGEHKNNARAMAKMELVNRSYIMAKVLGRKGFLNYSKLIIFQLFGILTSNARFSKAVWLGKFDGVAAIVKQK